MAEVKSAGKYRQEGKTYVVVDGDIIHFQVGGVGGQAGIPSAEPCVAVHNALHAACHACGPASSAMHCMCQPSDGVHCPEMPLARLPQHRLASDSLAL
jgi:hypothetical protein